jgi:hypothetical protein
MGYRDNPLKGVPFGCLSGVPIARRLTGEATSYEIFFAVKRAHRSDSHDIDMIVESAYAFDPARGPKVLGRMSIVGVLTATMEGRRPHTQKGGRKR